MTTVMPTMKQTSHTTQRAGQEVGSCECCCARSAGEEGGCRRCGAGKEDGYRRCCAGKEGAHTCSCPRCEQVQASGPCCSCLGECDEEPTPMYGPQGWTVQAGVWEVIAQARDEMRSAIIPARFGLAPRGLVVDGRPVEDYTPFHDLGPHGARRLLEILPAAALQDRQNLAPTLGCLLRACVRADGRMGLSGYAIGPQRPDERVSIEGLWVLDPDLVTMELSSVHCESCQCMELWETVRDRYGLDALCGPDEMSHVQRQWTHGPQGTWMWWD